MKNKFSKLVYDNLNENKSLALSLLFEAGEEDNDPQSDAEDAANKLFDMGEEGESEDETEETPEDETDSDEEDLDSSSTNVELQKTQFDALQNDIEKITNTLEQNTSDDGTKEITNFIAKSLSLESKNILYNKKSIGYFLFEKDDNLEKVSGSLQDLEDLLTKGTEVVNKFKKGKSLNIESYVDAAINAYRNFDNLFSKEQIVKQATINMLVLNSGAKAEENIKMFEELFHEELNKQFGIEYDEHALITPEMNVAAGAKSSS